MRFYVIRRNRRPLKLLILVPFVFVILIQSARLMSKFKDFKSDQTSLNDLRRTAELKLNKSVNKTMLNPMKLVNSKKKTISKSVSDSRSLKELLKIIGFVNANKTQLNKKQIKLLKKYIQTVNLNTQIRNQHFISNLLKLQKEQEANESINLVNVSNEKSVYRATKFLVILIQVHSRLNYLKELIQSLKETRHIEDALVIFSHDLFNSEINDLINTIDFCAVSVT